MPVSARLLAPVLAYTLSLTSILGPNLLLPAQAAGKAKPPKAIGVPNTKALFKDGIRLYNEKHYKEALTRFEEVDRARGSTDATAHYYMGLCCVGLKLNERAIQHFRQAANYAGDPQMKEMAEKGMNALKRAAPPPSTVQSRHGDAGMPEPSDSSSSSTETSSSSSTKLSAPIKKIVEFYCSTCQFCKEFAPTFDKARAKFGGTIRFDKVDGEEPLNQSLKAKYGVSGYPTLVYFDANGKVLSTKEGAPTEEEFFGFIEKNK